MDEDSKELIQKQSRAIAVLCLIILLLLVMILLMAFCERPFLVSKKTDPKETQLFCGTDLLIENRVRQALGRPGLSGDFGKGMKLFKQNCAVCHSLNKQKLTGPGLAGVFDRVPAPAETWIRNYILNNEHVKAKGDPYAKKLHAEYKQAMTIFEEQLSEEELKNLIYYVAGL